MGLELRLVLGLGFKLRLEFELGLVRVEGGVRVGIC